MHVDICILTVFSAESLPHPSRQTPTIGNSVCETERGEFAHNERVHPPKNGRAPRWETQSERDRTPGLDFREEQNGLRFV